MRPRPGVTLLEVLVAIMISGVGLLALLTLFPLGALEMASSVRDDRMGHIKHNASAVAAMLNLRYDTTGPQDPLYAAAPGVQGAMLNPTAGGSLPLATSFGPNMPSYPVFVDPIGFNRPAPAPFGSPVQNWVAGQVGVTPRRISYAGQGLTTPTPLLYSWNVFLDEIAFPRDADLYPNVPLGTPCPPGGFYERTPRYSWAYLAQMPQVRVPLEVDLSIIIFSGRPLDTPTLSEAVFTGANFDPGTSTATIGFPGAPPDIVIGSWIMDTAMTGAAGLIWPRANFHRVVGITQNSAGTMVLEVTPPPRATGGAAGLAYTGTVVFFENVVEVYYRGAY